MLWLQKRGCILKYSLRRILTLSRGGWIQELEKEGPACARGFTLKLMVNFKYFLHAPLDPHLLSISSVLHTS
jgi:hypothetical protein